MIKIQKELAMKERELREIIQKLRKELEGSPKGRLRISKGRRGNNYYYCDEKTSKEGKNGTYIKKKEFDLVKALAQKSYNEKTLEWAEKCHKQLLKLMKYYSDSAVTNFYDNMSEERKQLVAPIVKTTDTIIKTWEEVKYEGKKFQEETPIILTERGERVRSKSEKILADKFLMRNIPYKYECPLKLAGYGIVYPDFTLLDVYNEKLYYWEHFGMMDNQEYIEKAIKKIETYERNGIFPGNQLIMTFETKKSGLNMSNVDDILQEYFKKEHGK